MATMGEGRHVKGVIPSDLCFKTVLAAVWDRLLGVKEWRQTN